MSPQTGTAQQHLLAQHLFTLVFLLQEASRRGGKLVSLRISDNMLCGSEEEGDGEYDGSGLIALTKAISSLKALDISCNCLTDEGATTLIPIIKDNESLASLTFNGGIRQFRRWIEGDAVTIDIIKCHTCLNTCHDAETELNARCRARIWHSDRT